MLCNRRTRSSMGGCVEKSLDMPPALRGLTRRVRGEEPGHAAGLEGSDDEEVGDGLHALLADIHGLGLTPGVQLLQGRGQRQGIARR